jgi:7,8-dihydropterin-6-yl-methyl-4-(beta-D-ribofuranosyl)aminobenzene 5'-phosphate synthase
MEPLTRREALQQGGRFLVGAATCTLAPGLSAGCSSREVDPKVAATVMQDMQDADIADLRLTIIYDNVPHRDNLRNDWGFSCLIEGLDRTILFDAGRYDDIFISNLDKLGIDPMKIDALFLSHDHPDHIGGTLKLLEIKNELQVSLVQSFPSGFKKAVTRTGAALASVDQPRKISRHCLSTGEMSSVVKNEHALVILTGAGSIVITGCAHPGVVDIVERAKAITGRDVLLLAGGCHLLMDDAGSIRKKVSRIEELGVRYVAPSHCTGIAAIEIFAEVYGEHFIDSGVGRVIAIGQLT